MIRRININIADVRAEPRFRSERVNQVLFNEIVEVLEEKDDYSRTKSRDGYVGWIASQFLSEHIDFRSEQRYLVESNLAAGYEYPDINSKRLVYLPYGCSLYGDEEDGFLKMSTERYDDVYVPLTETLAITETIEPFLPDRDFIITVAEKFLSAPYLWGGRTFFGIDCSGFVQTVLRRFGWEIPRDTRDQADVGIEVKRDDIREGDLLFFPRHVVLAVSRQEYIHSSLGNGGVAYNSFDRESTLYNEYLDGEFKIARRVMITEETF